MGIEAGLVAYLNARAGLTAIVSDRIYPLLVPQAEKGAPDNYPAATYQIIDEPNEHSLAGVSQLAHPRVQLTGWGRTYGAALQVRDALVDAMDGFRGTMGTFTVSPCLKVDEGDMAEDSVAASPTILAARVYGRRLDFEIWFNEPVPTYA